MAHTETVQALLLPSLVLQALHSWHCYMPSCLLRASDDCPTAEAGQLLPTLMSLF